MKFFQHTSWNIIFAGSFSAVLFLASAGSTMAAENPSDPQHSSTALELKVQNKKVTGQFKDRSLAEVLNHFAGNGQIQFKIPEDLKDFPVSGQFEQVSLTDAIEQILRPFNYLVLAGTDSQPGTLFILNLRSGDPAEGPSPLAKAAPPQTKPTTQESAPPLAPGDVEMNEEMRKAFQVAGKNQGPPVELKDFFNQTQAPGTEKTGPPGPDNNSSIEFPDHALSLDEANLSDKQRAAFNVAGQRKGPPPELMDQFYPKQSPESVRTGPPAP